jgi:hypothetical protein
LSDVPVDVELEFVPSLEVAVVPLFEPDAFPPYIEPDVVVFDVEVADVLSVVFGLLVVVERPRVA